MHLQLEFCLNYLKVLFSFSSVIVIDFYLNNGATSRRNIEEDDSADAEVSAGDHKGAGESSSMAKEVSVDVKL